MENGFKSALEESPMESKPKMPSFAAEKLVSSLMKLDDIAINQPNDLIEVLVVWKCCLQFVYSRQDVGDIAESLNDVIHDGRVISCQLVSHVSQSSQVDWQSYL